VSTLAAGAQLGAMVYSRSHPKVRALKGVHEKSNDTMR